jgi:hypothetical protein
MSPTAGFELFTRAAILPRLHAPDRSGAQNSSAHPTNLSMPLITRRCGRLDGDVKSLVL